MKKHRFSLSIKARITIWYAMLLVAICVAAVAILVGVSEHAIDVYSSDTLRNAAIVLMDEMEVEHGLLEIDSDLEDVPNVYASLFDEEGGLIYGRRRVSLPFEHDAVRKTQWSGHSWYVYDVMLEIPDMDNVWLRLYMSSDVSAGVYDTIAQYSVVLLPIMGFVALAGGYWLTARAFRPVKEMTRLASSIAGGRDLSARVAMDERKGDDELRALAGTFNAMLSRLEDAFAHERRFTSDAAHELRTPLNAMRIQGEYALSRTDMAEKDEAVAQMLEKNEEMHALVSHLLMIARMDAGQLPLEDECELGQIIGQVVQDLEPVAQERNIRIEALSVPCSVKGNRAMLVRALVNLVDNAIRYGRQDGVVRVVLSDGEAAAEIAVEDDGAGIAQQDLPHVFERFWRADSSRASQGTGIGLSIVRAVAQAHGGSVHVQSEEGAGCRFTIRLPKK